MTVAARTIAGVTAATLIAGLGATSSRAGAADPSPNFVIVMIDDLDELVTPYADAMPQTMQWVRDRGVTFSSAIATTPTCCPARATTLTGKYAHNTGVYSNFGATGGLSTFQAHDNEDHTVAVHLDAAGYRTGLFGKYLNEYALQPTHIPPGWDDWFAFADDSFYDGYGYTVNDNGDMVAYGDAETDYSTDVVAGRTLRFLDDTEADDDAPFFAFVAATAPHIPIRPAPRHTVHPWSTATAPERPNTYEADLSDKPWWLRIAAPVRAIWRPYMTVDFRNRMGSLLAVDEMIGAVFARLEANGELDHTYVIVTSDNGYNLGAHHLNDKLAPYEESIRIPMMLTGPNVPAVSRPNLVALHDLMPTVLDLAGLPIPADVDGRSLRTLWDGAPAPPWRQSILLEYRPTVADGTPPDEIWFWSLLLDMPSYDAIRTDRYVFIRWWVAGELGVGTSEYELYDLQTDPYQLDNRLAAPSGISDNLAVLVTLKRQLDRLLDCRGAACP